MSVLHLYKTFQVGWLFNLNLVNILYNRSKELNEFIICSTYFLKLHKKTSLEELHLQGLFLKGHQASITILRWMKSNNAREKWVAAFHVGSQTASEQNSRENCLVTLQLRWNTILIPDRTARTHFKAGEISTRAIS